MQLSNLTLRLGGSLLHTVHKQDVTPAEILILKRIHGDDATVDIRPTKMDKRTHDFEWDRLSNTYDKASAMSAPGDESKSIMAAMFPGAVKKLPISLKEIGLGHLMSPASIKAAEAGAASGAPAIIGPNAGQDLDIYEPGSAPEDDDDGVPAEVAEETA